MLRINIFSSKLEIFQFAALFPKQFSYVDDEHETRQNE